MKDYSSRKAMSLEFIKDQFPTRKYVVVRKTDNKIVGVGTTRHYLQYDTNPQQVEVMTVREYEKMTKQLQQPTIHKQNDN